MFGKKQKEALAKPKLKGRQIFESDWITNFWWIEKKVYFTDSDLVHPYSTLVNVGVDDLVTHCRQSKNSFQDPFFVHPHPLHSTPQKANQSGLVFESRDEGYLYNLNFLNQKLYFSFIRDGDRGGVFLEKKLLYPDIVLLGTINHHLIGKSVLDKRTVEILSHNNYEVFNYGIQQICHVGEYEIYLNNHHQVICGKRVIFESQGEITITTFNHEKLLISEKRTKKLFVIFGNHFQNRKDLWVGNYFFHLLAVNGQIIIGKPLYDAHGAENYCLPLFFFT